MNQKLIVILGPTASGKSDLAVILAKKFNSEVVSADSRQVYKGMDLGSGKITKKEMRGIPHWLLDVISPQRKFSVSQYQKLALAAINKILQKDKLAILCGGTGFYIQAITDGLVIPEVIPNWQLRNKLEKLTTDQLFNKLTRLDSRRAATIDKFNRRRLIRALEIVATTKKPIPEIKSSLLPYPVLFIGIKKTKEELSANIKKRLAKRLKQGMINEVKQLRKQGLSWKRLEEFGLEYRFIAQYLQEKISYQEMIDKIQLESEHFAKRQMTWFKRNKRINWVKNKSEALRLSEEFLAK